MIGAGDGCIRTIAWRASPHARKHGDPRTCKTRKQDSTPHPLRMCVCVCVCFFILLQLMFLDVESVEQTPSDFGFTGENISTRCFVLSQKPLFSLCEAPTPGFGESRLSKIILRGVCVPSCVLYGSSFRSLASEGFPDGYSTGGCVCACMRVCVHFRQKPRTYELVFANDA